MRRPLVVSALLALAVRVAVIAVLPAPPAWDGATYAALAGRLAQGLGYVHAPVGGRAPVPTAFYPVGYPAALAAVLRVVHHPAPAAWVLNLLAALVTSCAVVAIGYRLSGRRGAWQAGVFHALYPGAVLWCAATMTETLTGALLAVACAAALVPADDRGTGWRALGGLALGAATLVRPQCLLAVPLAGAAGLHPRRVRVLGVLAATMAALLVVLPWAARNCRALGRCALVSTNGGANLLIGTLPDAHGGYRRPAPDACYRAARSEPERDACMTRLALRRLATHPGHWVLGAAQKLLRTVATELDPAWYLRDAMPTQLGPRRDHLPMGIAATLCWWWLLALSVRGARRGWASGREAREAVALLAGTAAVTLLAHGVFVGADRYHLPVVPLLIPLAGLGGRGRGVD